MENNNNQLSIFDIQGCEVSVLAVEIYGKKAWLINNPANFLKVGQDWLYPCYCDDVNGMIDVKYYHIRHLKRRTV